MHIHTYCADFLELLHVLQKLTPLRDSVRRYGLAVKIKVLRRNFRDAPV